MSNNILTLKDIETDAQEIARKALIFTDELDGAELALAKTIIDKEFELRLRDMAE